jgi:hypothetical protein
MIGIGSLLFHTFATRWSMLADVLPITVFIYGFLGFALRRFFRLSWPATLALVAVLGFFNAGVDRFHPAGLFNGSIMYLPAVAALLISSAVASIKALPPARLLALAGGTLLLSLVFRTIDRETCTLLPSGTHFLWHILNGIVLWFCLEAALRCGKSLPK